MSTVRLREEASCKPLLSAIEFMTIRFRDSKGPLNYPECFRDSKGSLNNSAQDLLVLDPGIVPHAGQWLIIFIVFPELNYINIPNSPFFLAPIGALEEVTLSCLSVHNLI